MRHNNLRTLVHDSWLLKAEKAFTIFKDSIVPALNEIAKTKVVFPTPNNILRVFKETPFDDVRVVIIAQDPYHDFGSATGIAFDNPKSRKPSPSLRNFLREIASDLGEPSKANENTLSYLEHLPGQGVLLLNTALTVESGKPESHLEIWAPFSKEIIATLNKSDIPIVWLLLGKKAQSQKQFITNTKHIVVEGAHPSPFSAKKFFGGKYFSKVNSFLKKPIKW